MPTPSPMDLLKQHAWNWISDLARRKPKIDVIQQRFRAAIPAVNGLSTPVQAAARSCLFGGAGQIYLGQKKKGTLIIVCAITGLLLYAIPGLIVIALGVYDAYVIGKRREHGATVAEWEFFWHPPLGTTWTVVRIVARGMGEEFLGVENLRVDNRQGNTPVRRSLRIQKEWQQSYVIEHEKVRRTMKEFEPAITKSSMVKHTVENLFREKYSYSETKTHLVEENVTVDVPPRTRIRLELRWKNIRDNWDVVVGRQSGEEVTIPVSIITKLSFDQNLVEVE